MPLWTRLLSSFMLVIAAWLWFATAQHSVLHRYAAAIAIGMSLGFLGDIFMARILKLPRYLLWGMLTFGLGHLFYITAFWGMVEKFAFGFDPRAIGVTLFWLLLGLSGWYFAVIRKQEQVQGLHIAALAYALLLCTTAAAATLLALQAPVFLFSAIGAALFLLSDLILSVRLFRQTHFYLINDVVWLLYGPAQAMIVYSIWHVM